MVFLCCMLLVFVCFFFFFFFFFNDTATTEIYTLSLHDALPISFRAAFERFTEAEWRPNTDRGREFKRSEEHTSELQSLRHLVCRLLLEKKKNKIIRYHCILKKQQTKQS